MTRARRARRWLRIWIAGLGLALASCATVPCSRAAAAVLDATCAETVAEVWQRECPDVELADCAEALAVLAACDALVEQQATRCAP